MKLYVIRHGETVWNAVGRTQGRSHNRLSKLGEEQAKEAAEKLKEIEVDVIFSSPLYRTVRTANIVNKNLNKKIIKDERITEIDQGIYAGRYKNSFTEEEKHNRKIRSKEAGLETYEEAFARIVDFLKSLKQTNYENVLIVSHRSVCCLIECYNRFGTYTKENYKIVEGFDNAEVRKYVF